MTTNTLHTEFNNQRSSSTRHIQNITKEKQQTRTGSTRSKSADYPRRASSMVSSSKTRLTTISVDEVRRTSEDERHRLTILNNRFADYLDRIKTLADRNINLRRQIDAIYQKYTGYNDEKESNYTKNHRSSEIEFDNLRRQLNNELRQLISTQIRFQRADYDKKIYKNKFKFFSTSDQNQLMQQQLNSNLYELDLLKQQYDKRNQELQVNIFIKDFHSSIYFL
jgi:hypothetical protein